MPYSQRARSIGIYETSWALGLLIGAPILALVITRWSWRAGYLTLLAATLAVMVVIGRSMRPAPTTTDDSSAPQKARLGFAVWPPILASALSAVAGIGFFAIAGQWFSDVHHVGAGGLGLIAGAYGVVELVASSSVATVTDRIGPRRAVIGGLLLVLGAAALLAVGGSTLWVAIVGVVLFMGGFEYAFVSSIALVTEAAPRARGTAIGLSNAVGTVGRGIGVFAAGSAYVAFGINGPLVLAVGAAIAAVVCASITKVADGSTPTEVFG